MKRSWSGRRNREKLRAFPGMAAVDTFDVLQDALFQYGLRRMTGFVLVG